MEQDKRLGVLFFNSSDLARFANERLAAGLEITGFSEEILLGLFLLRWFKDGQRGDSDFSIGFKYKTGSEKVISELIDKGDLTIKKFNEEFSENDTLSDVIIKSTYGSDPDLMLQFQIKAFPRVNKPETITEDLVSLLEKKKHVTVDNEVLIIYSHYTIGLNHGKVTKYLETYPYGTVIQIFWTNKDTLNFLKLKPNTRQHYSLSIGQIFDT